MRESHSGLLRHLYLREASATGALMVCLVGNGDELPHSGELVKEAAGGSSCLESVVFNSNQEKTNVILENAARLFGGKTELWIICAVCPFSCHCPLLLPVNRDQAEILYRLLKRVRLFTKRRIRCWIFTADRDDRDDNGLQGGEDDWRRGGAGGYRGR